MARSRAKPKKKTKRKKKKVAPARATFRFKPEWATWLTFIYEFANDHLEKILDFFRDYFFA